MDSSSFRRTHFGSAMGVGNYSCPSFEIPMSVYDHQKNGRRQRTEQEMEKSFFREYDGVVNFVRVVNSKQFDDLFKSTVKTLGDFFTQSNLFNELTPQIISS